MGSSEVSVHSNGDGSGASAAAALLRDVRARLTELDASPTTDLVVGIWKPSAELCVVALAGEMDLSNAAQITRELDGRLGPGPCRLVVELSRLTFMDSTGITQLVALS